MRFHPLSGRAERLVRLVATAVALASVPASELSAEADRKLRFAVGVFSHEATTFSKSRVTIDDMATASGDALVDAKGGPLGFNEIAGFAREAAASSNVEIVGLRSYGSPYQIGPFTTAAFEQLATEMADDLRRQMPVDGVYLMLHGSAAVDGIRDPEAELARRLRAVVGPDIPIVATFDPHGNEDAEFLKHANASLSAKYFPHYDERLQAERAARLLKALAEKRLVLTTATRKPGIITPTVVQWTGRGVWAELVQRALVWEAKEPDSFVSIFFGYPWNDSETAGMTIQVMTNRDQKLADRIADDLNAFAWRKRRELLDVSMVPVAELSAAIAAERARGPKPIVVADYSDRGGDATHILRTVVEQDLDRAVFAGQRDERVIAKLKRRSARAGDDFDEMVGGFAELPASGKPVRIKGRLAYFGPSPGWTDRKDMVAVVEFGRSNWLVLTEQLRQITAPEQIAFTGIPLEAPNLWILKSRVHFRSGFEDTGFMQAAIIVDPPEPYLGTVHLDKLPYRHVRLKTLYPYSDPSFAPFGKTNQ